MTDDVPPPPPRQRPTPPPTPGPTPEESKALEAEEAEIRRLVEAGASTPEELRALAARIRAHREHEQQLWERTVKPTLSRKGSDSDQTRRSLLLGLGAIGAVGLLVLASFSGNAGLVVGVVALIGAGVYLVRQQRT